MVALRMIAEQEATCPKSDQLEGIGPDAPSDLNIDALATDLAHLWHFIEGSIGANTGSY